MICRKDSSIPFKQVVRCYSSALKEKRTGRRRVLRDAPAGEGVRRLQHGYNKAGQNSFAAAEVDPDSSTGNAERSQVRVQHLSHAF